MSKSESGVNNRVFTLVMVAIGLGLVSAWFFLHPNSPWHSRNTYVVAFKEIGTLVPGNVVQVNGLGKGKVIGATLTDTCVWVSMAVLADVPVTTSSRFKIVNAGLMGERVIDIQLNEGGTLLSSGDTVKGTFDMGSTRLAMVVIGCLREVKDLVVTAKGVVDTVLSPDNQARYQRIGRKGVNLVGKVEGDVDDWMDSVRVLSGNLDTLQSQAERLSGEIKPELMVVADSLQVLKTRFLALQAPLADIGARAKSVAARLDQADNSVGLTLQDKAMHARVRSIVGRADSLMAKIQKTGMDLNVDIW